MKTHILKSILIGIGAGAVLFIMPFFVLRTLLFVLLIGGLFRLFAGRWFGWRGRHASFHHGFHPAFADTIRNMSEEEYRVFRGKLTYPYAPPSGENPKTESK